MRGVNDFRKKRPDCAPWTDENFKAKLHKDLKSKVMILKPGCILGSFREILRKVPMVRPLCPRCWCMGLGYSLGHIVCSHFILKYFRLFKKVVRIVQRITVYPSPCFPKWPYICNYGIIIKLGKLTRTLFYRPCSAFAKYPTEVLC